MRAVDDITGKDDRLTRKLPLGLCIHRPGARARVWTRGGGGWRGRGRARGIISEVLLERWGGTAGTWVQTHRKTGFRRAV